jgi:16S rRNA (adenine1518-N6/adenine1519-N6)-dimethyltransferase
MNFVRAKKQLGQHFLKDDNIASRIADSLSEQVKAVLEVGPGMGVLTKFLLRKPYENLKVIELDLESVDYLRANYPELGEGLIAGDFLRTDISSLFPGNFSLIGNFPYNISSQIFFKVLDNRNQIDEVVVGPAEVARRIASGPEARNMESSRIASSWYNIEYLFTVLRRFYSPSQSHLGCVRLRLNTVNDLAAILIFQVG